MYVIGNSYVRPEWEQESRDRKFGSWGAGEKEGEVRGNCEELNSNGIDEWGVAYSCAPFTKWNRVFSGGIIR